MNWLIWVVWAWTAFAAMGLLFCSRETWNAWLDWQVVDRQQVNGRTRAVARLSLFIGLYFVLKFAVALSIGVGLLQSIRPISEYWPLGLLVVEIAAVALVVQLGSTRAYLMRVSDRRQHDDGPPDGVERRQS